MDSNTLLAIGIIICSGLITGGIIMLLRSTLTNTQWKAATFYAGQLVQAGYQLWHSGQMQKTELYQRAATLLKTRYPNLTDDQINTLVESAYSDLKILLGHYTTTQP